LAKDDAAAACLAPLAAKGCQVLGIGAGADPCPLFGKRCMELGFDFTWSSRSLDVAKFAVDRFEPELLLCVPGGTVPPPFARGVSGPPAYAVRLGGGGGGGPWPEFAPIWLGHKASRVSLVACPPAGMVGAEVLSREVPVAGGETAVSLRMKHIEAAAELIAALLDAGVPPQPAAATDSEAEAPMEEDGAEEGGGGTMPERVSLDWDDAEVDRFLRARLLPPHSPAEVVDPATGEAYFVENLQQYEALRVKVLGAGSPKKTTAAEDKPKLYAADTHWYSNMGGSIVKISDQSIHAPRRVADGPFRMVIPGASVGGGAREKLRMNEPLIGPNAERYCSSVLASGWIGVEGPFVKKFEAHIARICGCIAACAVQSGTAALYGAMKALGVSDPTHHVLCPSFTCAACADAVVHAGGTPIPIDCELDTYSISASAVKSALQNNPHVVGVVTAPCYGVPSRDMYGIIELCKERGLWLCEDACESYGATMHASPAEGEAAPVPLGSLATLSVVSVRSEKMVGVGEGGAIVGNDTTLVGRARWWCSRAPCRGGGLWRVYEHEGVGQNFRLPEMLAAVGCAAAEMLPTMIERKRAIHAWYETHMVRPGLDGVKLQASVPGDDPVWWLNAALLPEGISAEEVGMQLMKEYPDIEIRPGFFPLDQMAIFAGAAPAPCPNTDLLFRRLVCLPSSSLLKEAHVERICGALADSLSKVATKVAGRPVRSTA